ncbi:MAG: NYN domain-containing protein [Spirulinaceae cyanobacterium]
MQHQKWFTLGISTAIASAVASVVLFSNKPASIIAASTLGALGGVFMTQSQHRQSSRLERLTLAQEDLAKTVTQLTILLDRNYQNLAKLQQKIEHSNNQLSENSQLNSSSLETLLKHNNSEIANLQLKIKNLETRPKSSKNVAVLYDIENLIKGYSFSRKMLAKLSLKKILNTIEKSEIIDTIAIQQAYANWSDARLKLMRTELNELGIEPVQVFGFSQEPIKNAADIQLVIDAIDLAYLRTSIDIFVIVSGDGGFAALAKKLHEYGKIVIGCAYQNSTSKTFRSVCDDFIWIQDPETELKSKPESKQKSIPKKKKGLDIYNTRLVTEIETSTETNNPEIFLGKTKEIINWYAQDEDARQQLLDKGISLSTIQVAIKRLIPNLKILHFGFVKFIEYIQYACRDTPICVVRLQPSSNVLILRESPVENAIFLPDLEVREIQSIDTYRAILATGIPIFRLPEMSELHAIATWIVQNPLQQQLLGTAIQNVFTGLNQTISEEAIKQTLLGFVSANILIGESEQSRLSEKRLSLSSQSVEDIFTVLRQALSQKIIASLAAVDLEIDSDIFAQIVPNPGTKFSDLNKKQEE